MRIQRNQSQFGSHGLESSTTKSSTDDWYENDKRYFPISKVCLSLEQCFEITHLQVVILPHMIPICRILLPEIVPHEYVNLDLNHCRIDFSSLFVVLVVEVMDEE